jgi:hypothetical protein
MPSGCAAIPRCVGWLAVGHQWVKLPRPARWAASETEWLTRPDNLVALSDLPGHWIDTVHSRRPPRIIVLDMGTRAKARPTASRKAAPTTATSAACAIIHCSCSTVQPTRLCRAMRPAIRQRPQRRGLAHGAGAGDRPLTRHGEAALFPRRRCLRQPGDLRVPRSRGHGLRDPAAGQPGSCRTRLETCSSSRSVTNNSSWPKDLVTEGGPNTGGQSPLHLGLD